MDRSAASILVTAVAARALLAFLQIYYGITTFSDLPELASWADFYGVYGHQLSMLASSAVPYVSIPYSYPPLFLYSLYPFYWAGGIHAASIPIVLSDVGASVIIYVIALKVGSSRTAFLAGVGYALSPFALFYEGYLWLSSEPVTFFLLLSVLLLLGKNPTYSALSFAAAVLFKQEALFLLPAFGLWYYRTFPTKWMRGLLVFSATIILISTPFLLESPTAYLSSLSFGVGSVPCLTTFSSCTPGPNIYTLGEIVTAIMAVLTLPFVIGRTGSRDRILQCVYSLSSFLFLFGLLVHPLHAYYYLPVYALLFASSTSKFSLLVSAVAPGLALLVPSQPIFIFSELSIQQMLPFTSVLVIQLWNDFSQERAVVRAREISPIPLR